MKSSWHCLFDLAMAFQPLVVAVVTRAPRRPRRMTPGISHRKRVILFCSSFRKRDQEDSLTDSKTRNLRVGHKVEDWCRPCKSFRAHAVTVVSGDAKPLRVTCDTCGSQHNFRGRGPIETTKPVRSEVVPTAAAAPFEERNRAPMGEVSNENQGELERLLRRIIREEAGLTPVAPAEKWRGGELVLRPGREGLQEKRMPIDSLFQKVVSIRNRLRVLEQQINTADLPTDLKLKLQSYISGCYGSLTSFNVLFSDEEDRFHGSGKPEE